MVKRQHYYDSLKKQHRYKILVENVSTTLDNIIPMLSQAYEILLEKKAG